MMQINKHHLKDKEIEIHVHCMKWLCDFVCIHCLFASVAATPGLQWSRQGAHDLSEHRKMCKISLLKYMMKNVTFFCLSLSHSR